MQIKKEPIKETPWWHRLLLAHLPKKETTGGVYPLAVGGFLGLSTAIFAAVPLLFSVNPLSLALLCAAEGQAAFWVLGGLLLGAWQSGASHWYVVSALCVLPLRALARLFLTPPADGDALPPGQLRAAYWTHTRGAIKRLFQKGSLTADPPPKAVTPPLPLPFDEPLYLRAAVSVVCALIPALAIPAAGGFAYYDLYGAVFTLALTPAVTTLFALLLSSTPPKTRQGRAGRAVGALVLIGALCLCGRSITILGLSPIVVMGTILSLVAVKRLGLGGGLVTGLVCGLCYDPLTIPMFMLVTLLYALLQQAMRESALIPAALVGLIYLLISGDATAFWLLSPSLIGGCLLYGAGRRLNGRIRAEAATKSPSAAPDDEQLQNLLEQEARHEALIRRLSDMSGAFSRLAEIFRQIEKNTACPTTAAIRRLCDEQMEPHCRTCPLHGSCYDEQSLALMNTLHAFRRALSEQGQITDKQFDDAIRARCPHKRAIVQDINHAMTRLSYETLRQTGGGSFAGECDEVAHLLRDAVRQDAATPDRQKAHPAASRIRAYLDAHQMHAEQVVLLGDKRLQLRLFGLTPASLTVPQEQFRREISEILEAPLSNLQFDGSDVGCLSLHTLPPLRADYVHRTLAAQQSSDHPGNRSLCGDTLRVFVSNDGVFYALVCDGMGKGREAAVTSGAAGVFLERTLRAGVEVHTALRMLNHYLLSRASSPEEEISSTIDLFALDLYTGQGYFLKSGAAPSLILREGRLFRLSSHTLPIGILQAIDTQVIPFAAKAGDHILLMSDGVCDIENEDAAQPPADWLSDYLSGALPEEDNALICELFSLARQHGSLDDMSLISIRISKDS